jgi:hypothetical protein
MSVVRARNHCRTARGIRLGWPLILYDPESEAELLSLLFAQTFTVMATNGLVIRWEPCSDPMGFRQRGPTNENSTFVSTGLISCDD